MEMFKPAVNESCIWNCPYNLDNAELENSGELRKLSPDEQVRLEQELAKDRETAIQRSRGCTGVYVDPNTGVSKCAGGQYMELFDEQPIDLTQR